MIPADHPDVAPAIMKLEKANSYSALGRHAEALDLYEQALAVYRSVFPADHPNVASAIWNTADSHRHLGHHAEALDLYKQAYALYRRALPADHPDIPLAMLSIANSYHALGRHAEALDLYEQALAFFRRVFHVDHPDIATCMFNIAQICPLLNFISQSSWFAHEELDIRRFQFADSHPNVKNSLHTIQRLTYHFGAAAIQPMPNPSCDHLRIGRLVRLHGLRAHALNGRQALVFGPEQNGRVAVRLVEASDEVRAAVGWERGVEKKIKVENLQAMGQANAKKLCGADAERKVRAVSACVCATRQPH